MNVEQRKDGSQDIKTDGKVTLIVGKSQHVVSETQSVVNETSHSAFEESGKDLHEQTQEKITETQHEVEDAKESIVEEQQDKLEVSKKAIDEQITEAKSKVEDAKVNIQEHQQDKLEDTKNAIEEKKEAITEQTQEAVQDLKDEVDKGTGVVQKESASMINKGKEIVEDGKDSIEKEKDAVVHDSKDKFESGKVAVVQQSEEALAAGKNVLEEGKKGLEEKKDALEGGKDAVVNAAANIQKKSETYPVITVVDNKEVGLYAHNEVRKLHGLKELTWNEELAEAAKEWALHLAENDSGLQHSPNADKGENIYISKGTSKYTQANQAVMQWYKTASQFNYSLPEFTLTTGTFTQLVWDNTTDLGMAVVFHEERKTTYIVAQYFPPGNFADTRSYSKHVRAPKNGMPPRAIKAEELYPKDVSEDAASSGSNMKSLVDVLCHWCISTDEKPVESWSGKQQPLPEGKSKAPPIQEEKK